MRTKSSSRLGSSLTITLSRLDSWATLIPTSPDFRTNAAGGVVGFSIGEYGWGFEFSHDGSNLKDHWDRFMLGGRYHKWVLSGEMEDWLLLDFRTNFPRELVAFLLSADSQLIFGVARHVQAVSHALEGFQHVSVLDHNLERAEEFKRMLLVNNTWQL